MVINNGGFLVRIFKCVFNMVNKSWYMYFVGFLFGLGFDIVIEIGVLGILVVSVIYGMNLWLIMVFFILFVFGMVLIDLFDNFVMIGVYGWVFLKLVWKLYYNIIIIVVLVIIVFFIGGIEVLGLIVDKFNLIGGIWILINNISENLGEIGYWIIGMFILCWVIFVVNYYVCGYDKLSIIC